MTVIYHSAHHHWNDDRGGYGQKMAEVAGAVIPRGITRITQVTV